MSEHATPNETDTVGQLYQPQEPQEPPIGQPTSSSADTWAEFYPGLYVSRNMTLDANGLYFAVRITDDGLESLADLELAAGAAPLRCLTSLADLVSAMAAMPSDEEATACQSTMASATH
jgi:hypothetical protein